MARRAAAKVEESATPVETPIAEVSTPPKQRRTRRRRVVDYATQNQVIISVLLTARAGRGATQSEIETAVLWGRSVRAEAAELATLAKRPRLRKAEVSTQRQAAADLNKTLLDGVLSGNIGLDVNGEGNLVFAISRN